MCGFVNVTRKIGNNFFYARSHNFERRLLTWSCLSVRPRGTTQLPVDGFS